MEIRAASSTRVFGLLFAGGLGCLCLVFGLVYVVRGQPEIMAIAGPFGIVLLLVAASGWDARLYADEQWVGRTRPWPSRCLRADLRGIRLGGSILAPTWYFVRQDGSSAFTVGAPLFPQDGIRRLAGYLGVPVEGAGLGGSESGDKLH